MSRLNLKVKRLVYEKMKTNALGNLTESIQK